MAFVRVPPDGAGKKIYSKTQTVNGDEVETQVFHLADPFTPANIQRVDQRGQASIRFAEGSPTLDSYSNMRVGEQNAVGVYEFTNSDYADLFQDVTVVDGQINHDTNISAAVLSCGSVATAAAKRTTNRYHYSQPGVAQIAYLAVACSDQGKANNVRRWGYYDDHDGIFFELSGTTLYAVYRSSFGGNVNEIRVPQTEWNGDKLDGTGLSGVTLDVSRPNIYGIDIATLGTGYARLGIRAPDGSRWVAHLFTSVNSASITNLNRTSLPLRWENFNTGLTSGPSELRQYASAVYSQSKVDYTVWRWSDIERSTPITVTTNTPILSMRVAAGSRIGVYPESIDSFVQGGAVKFSIVDDGALTGPTWSQIGGGFAEGDIAATAVSGGERFITWYVNEGATHKDITEYYETNDEGYHRLADDSDSQIFTLVATKLSGTTVTVAATLTYKELV